MDEIQSTYRLGYIDGLEGNPSAAEHIDGPDRRAYDVGYANGRSRAAVLSPTRPDPTRAEMATAILCALYSGPYRNHIANHETFLEASEEAIAMTDAFRAALDRKEASR